ncbi:MAG: CoA transferase [Chloroflexota bacterium]|nr:MAG: CoA transferase [Chloroflexota bacterium]
MLPLDGVKVIDLTRVLAGPYCSMVLGDLGAEVIKVEAPGPGDDARGYGPFAGGRSAYFMSLNRNKKSVTLDLKTSEGEELLAGLVAESDVLLENYRPGTLDRLGFPWSRLHEINPGLICCHVSGFGQTGPYRDRPAYDIIVQGMGGLMSITGQPGGMPTRAGASVGDITAGLYATVAILAALRVREQTGQGQEIDISMLDCQVAILENAIARYTVTGQVPEPLGNRHPSISPFTSVRARDGYLIVAAGNDAQWRKLCVLLERPELAEDPRFRSNEDRTSHWGELEPILDQLFRARSAAEWLELLEREGLPCGPINDVARIVSDPQVRARGMICETDVNGTRVGFSRSPIRLSLTPLSETFSPSPDLGQHNEEILAPLRKRPGKGYPM